MTTDVHVISGTELDALLDERERELFAQLRAEGLDPCPDCWIPRIDGVCRPCRMQAILSADPDYSAWSDAQARLDFGAWAPDSDRPYTYDDMKADQALQARLEAKFLRAEADAKTDPNACQHCRTSARSHGQRWAPGVGFHVFTEPSDGQRLARMYARRAARLGLPVWSRPGAASSSLPTERS